MRQALNILENFDLKSMGYDSARYIHTLYQAMNLAFADRDFYYGDPYFPPEEPLAGLLSKKYADARRREIDPARNDPAVGPGDPYPFQGGTNPYRGLLEHWKVPAPAIPGSGGSAASTSAAARAAEAERQFDESFRAGTTSVVAADEEGWVVSMTPSGGWVPAYIAGRTGIGLSQRMQSFVLDE